LRPLGKVDIAQLRDAVLAIPESVWDAEDQGKPNRRYQQVVGGAWVPVPGRIFATTRHIVFRFVTSQQDWRESADRPLWPEWRERLLPVMEQATRPYGYVRAAYPRVMMLARMAFGRGNPPARG
jgi:hypothetical protein